MDDDNGCCKNYNNRGERGVELEMRREKAKNENNASEISGNEEARWGLDKRGTENVDNDK